MSAEARPIEARDVDVLILRSEQFGPFELDDAVLAADYKKAVQVVGSMLDEGVEPLIVLSRIVRVLASALRRKGSCRAREARKMWRWPPVVPAWKAADFAAACRKFEWKQLAVGFRAVACTADRAFKTSTPNPGRVFRRDALEIDRAEPVTSGLRVRPLTRFRQAGLVSAGGVFLDHALLDGLVDQAECFRQQCLWLAGFPDAMRGSQLLHLGLQLVPVHLVDQAPALLALPVPLKCGWMVCHRISLKNRNA